MRSTIVNVLIDTSAWIDFFRDIDGAAGDLVADLIRLDRAYLTGPVMAELLHGVRGKREATQLHSVFAAIPVLEISQKDWIATGNTLHTLRKKGLTIPLTDVLIASVAIANNMPVLTLDKHFRHLSAECIQIP
ncbi:MAG: PIN domain nuclease [Candidatus Electrothrix sp. AR3]|nr:PIN domain nuclease [Candidatus Electrothrix sp. AR3]